MTTIFGEKVLRYDKHHTDSSESVLNNENDLLNSFVNLNGQADPSRIRPCVFPNGTLSGPWIDKMILSEIFVYLTTGV